MNAASVGKELKSWHRKAFLQITFKAAVYMEDINELFVSNLSAFIRKYGRLGPDISSAVLTVFEKNDRLFKR